jgi:hypothetical protein
MERVGNTVVAVAGVFVFLTLTVSTAAASPNGTPALNETIVSPAAGTILADQVIWAVQVSGAPAKRVDFAIDGKLASRLPVPGDAGVRTYRYGGASGLLDTRTLRDGAHRLKVTTYAKGGSSVTAKVTVTVTNGPMPGSMAPRLISPPVVSGDALVGQMLTSTEGQWAGSTPMNFSFAWLRCAPDCVPIAGAAGSTYTLTGGDSGAAIRSQVTASNALGSASESSAPTAVVGSNVVETALPWRCSGLVNIDLLRVVVATEDNAVNLAGCTGRIGRIEVEQRGGGDGIKIQPFGAHDLVIEGGFVHCTPPATTNHVDGMQSGGGVRVTFRSVRFFCGSNWTNSQFFTTGWGGDLSTDVVCERCVFGPGSSSTFYVGFESVRSGARDSIVCAGRFFDVRVENAVDPLNTGNVVVSASDPRCQFP